MGRGLRLFTERVGDGAGQPLLDEDNGEELMHVQPGVSVVLANRSPESLSTSPPAGLFNSVDRSYLKAEVTDIETEGEDDESECSDAECNETLDISKIIEIRLVPLDPSQLDALFKIFCECAELNPEPVEDEEEHGWVFSADQI